MAPSDGPTDNRPVLFFDIDNCLYPRSLRIQDLMADLIDNYFVKHLSLSAEAAIDLHRRYYRDYGLAISGLVKHHEVDPLAYNKEVDDALPLEGIIKRDEGLRRLLAGVDKTKCKLWLYTNAYYPHAQRVVRLLGVAEFFEGMTYCNYAEERLVAKPHAESFEKAEAEAGLMFDVGQAGIGQRHDRCFFVDDSALNCKAAKQRGWNAVHKLEAEDPEPAEMFGQHRIRHLVELKNLFPQFWKDGEHQTDGPLSNGATIDKVNDLSSQA